jgi:drug/metabolite transporter (DMT)-like permease
MGKLPWPRWAQRSFPSGNSAPEGNAVKGVSYGAIAALLWSTVFVVARFILRQGEVHPLALVFLRFLTASIFLFLLALILPKSHLKKIQRRDWGRFFFLSLVGIVGMGSLGFLATNFVSAIDVTLLVNANPIFIALLASLVGERITTRKVMGIILGFWGCLWILKGGLPHWSLNQEALLGHILAISSGFCWALYTVMGKEMVRKYGGFYANGLAIMMGTAILFVLVLIFRIPFHLTSQHIGLVIYLGVLPTAIAFGLWYKALGQIGAARLGPLQYLAPVASALQAYFLLGEAITIAYLIGMALVFLGIYWATGGK